MDGAIRGKKVEMTKPRLKISVPRFDKTELIARYARTLIGRCLNPSKQDMKTLLFMLPRIWQVEGRVTGSDLGLGRFQFDFVEEEDILEVLKMEPFHFDYWMISLVRWKPVLDVNYPSKITFWVRVMDVPLQFWAASTFESIGGAIGQVHGEVDLLEGRVRVEVDGYKPLVFSMEVDFDEGVELLVSLRYEKLFGFCRQCFCLTHDQSRCPSLVPAVEEGVGQVGPKAEQGAHLKSYKGAVTNGKDASEDHKGDQQMIPNMMKDGNKGKGIVRDWQGSFRQDGAYRAYKERVPRGFGEGSSRGGRYHGYGVFRGQQDRFAINPRGLQNLRNAEEQQNLSNPEKLMLDAFKGTNHLPKASNGDGDSVAEVGSQSKARKCLQFDEEFKEENPADLGMVSDQNEAVFPQSGEDEMKKNAEDEDQEFPSALDAASLMLEGELLSDSELLDDVWEEGEVPDFMEEEGLVQDGTGSNVITSDPNGLEEGLEEIIAKPSKKKALKTGVFGGATKKRLVQNILSPRKNKISKVPVKNDKGKGDGKKNNGKPKDGDA